MRRTGRRDGPLSGKHLEAPRRSSPLTTLSAQGVAGLHVGPVDLGLGLGLGHDWERPEFSKALDRIVEAGHAAGVSVTMHAVRTDQSQRWLQRGFDELVLTSDIELRRGAFQSGMAQLRRPRRSTPKK